MTLRPPDWTQATDRLLARVERLSLQAAADATGVSLHTIRRWRELRAMGEPVPEPRGEPRAALLRAWDAADEAGPWGDDEAEAEALFEHFERLVRRMEGEGVAPHELWLRKLDVIEGLKRLYGAAGGVPGWVYRLAATVAAEHGGGRAALDEELDEDVRRLNQALGVEDGLGVQRRGGGGLA